MKVNLVRILDDRVLRVRTEEGETFLMLQKCPIDAPCPVGKDQADVYDQIGQLLLTY